MSWSARIHLKSEAIFGSGQSTPGEVDLEVLHDDYGFPYYGSRTLKGHWLEQTKLAAKVLGQGAASRAKAAELAAVAALIGKLPTPEEYQTYVAQVDKTAVDTYRYLNFNQLSQYTEKADGVIFQTAV